MDAVVVNVKILLQEPILQSATYLLAIVTLACWLLSVLKNNSSIVDRLWSILPVVYIWYFVLSTATSQSTNLTTPQDLIAFFGAHPLLAAIAAFAFVWGFRLTYNFARKGGYSLSSEDYRWEELRTIIGSRLVYEIFNVVFISVYQNLLIFLFALPVYVPCKELLAAGRGAWQTPHDATSLTPVRWLLLAVLVALFALEVVADQSQWNYYERRAAFRARRVADPSGELQRGFLSSGVFAWSRHPNFFAEQAMWWCVLLLALPLPSSLAPDAWTAFLRGLRPVHYAASLGAPLLSMLFHGSSAFTEKLTVKKYPEYAVYQEAVSRLVPSILSRKPAFAKKKA